MEPAESDMNSVSSLEQGILDSSSSIDKALLNKQQSVIEVKSSADISEHAYSTVSKTSNPNKPHSKCYNPDKPYSKLNNYRTIVYYTCWEIELRNRAEK